MQLFFSLSLFMFLHKDIENVTIVVSHIHTAKNIVDLRKTKLGQIDQNVHLFTWKDGDTVQPTHNLV